MNDDKSLSDHLASYIYKLEDIKHVNSSQSLLKQQNNLSHVILLFKEAKGDIIINERSYSLQRQNIFLLSPDAKVKLFIDSNYTCDYFQLRFHALQAVDTHAYTPGKIGCPVELSIKNFHVLIDKLYDIDRKFHSKDVWGPMSANIIFQEMMLFLFNDAIHNQKKDLNKAITLTKEYMGQNYCSNITRKNLADIAGVSTDYYSRAFKKETGKSPMEYLADIRIKKAKQLLVLTEDKLSSIAHKVGFSDEFYFSRKFKAVTGCSPTIYIKKFKYSNRIVSLKHLSTGHLMALGIEPYAAVINKAYPITTQLQNTIAIGDSEPDLEKLMTANPDLIITRDYQSFDKSPKEKIFDQIAPTVTLPFSHDWRELFQMIAKIVGKEKKANSWLEHYDRKAEMIGKGIQNKIEDETILIVGVGKGKMCVYGQRNMGTVLYRDLKLNVPKNVGDIAHYREICLEELSNFDADRILLTSYKHDGTEYTDEAIRKEVRMLFTNKLWQDLKAVRNGNVYCMYDSQHLYTSYNPLSHNLFLNKLNQLFLTE
ncbi:ABC transporter substrate-binding protein [Alkalihalobacillus sp. BA299]|uniref:ABC transporter substrate-binding protein n=1 Tax=Alkalihalobacillus sp. BA299 TaxID=2815938 RepID=UPI001ADCF16C|nr:ABC transporter substrate-binding protein [Alkalihalobacillus sp. BA299]